MKKIICVFGFYFFVAVFMSNSLFAVDYISFVSCSTLYDQSIQFDKYELSQDAKDISSEMSLFLGYSAASAEWYSFTASMLSNGKNKGIPAEGVSTGQVARVFSKWLKNNPEYHHMGGKECFGLAMLEAFP